LYSHHLLVSFTMPPKQTTKDKLSDVEKTLLDIAVRLYSAVKYHEEHKGEVSEGWLVQGIEEELVRVLYYTWLRSLTRHRRIQSTRYLMRWTISLGPIRSSPSLVRSGIAQ
jgi:hypothetical protein